MFELKGRSLHNPQLWLEARKSDGPYRNQVYEMPIASAREIRSIRTVSTLSTQYFGPSRSTLGFEARVLEQVEKQVAKLKEELKAQLKEEK